MTSGYYAYHACIRMCSDCSEFLLVFAGCQSCHYMIIVIDCNIHRLSSVAGYCWLLSRTYPYSQVSVIIKHQPLSTKTVTIKLTNNVAICSQYYPIRTPISCINRRSRRLVWSTDGVHWEQPGMTWGHGMTLGSPRGYWHLRYLLIIVYRSVIIIIYIYKYVLYTWSSLLCISCDLLYICLHLVFCFYVYIHASSFVCIPVFFFLDFIVEGICLLLLLVIFY